MSFANAPSTGEKNGQKIGTKSGIAVNAAVEPEGKRRAMAEKKSLSDQYKNSAEGDEYSSFAFHPYNVLLILVIFSLSILFLALSISFVYTRIQSDLPALKLPNLFLINTLVLVASSGSIYWAKKNYLADDTENYKLALYVTMGLSFLFLMLQFVAWGELFQQKIFINTDTSSGYLYVISGLHFAHVIGGIPFLGYFIWQARQKMKEPVSVLIYFSDPEKRLKLRLLTIYWHFLDALWIYLVLFFFINYLIQ